ncbi:MAG: hypothetical protein K9M11_00560 [Candidatus Pacebacteria bacterium]|nr:hypothetical protein [Candidatus Paceibacterota bacterium]
MNKLEYDKIKSYGQKWFILPVVSAILVIATLPPIKIWWLCFICLVPIYLFTRISDTYPWKRTALGGFLFGIIFTAFILSLTVLQFHWVEETYLFTELIRISSLFILIFIGIFASFQILLLRLLKSQNAVAHIFYAAGCWTFSEWCTHKMMFSIEYSIIGYPAHNTTFASLAQYGGVYMTIFAIALINMSIGSILYYLIKRSNRSCSTEVHKLDEKNIKRSIAVLFFCIAGALVLHELTIIKIEKEKSTNEKSSIDVSLIQDQDKTESPFGEEKTDTQTGETYFSFPRLQKLVLEAQKDQIKPQIIIYPFAPWNGAITEKKNKNLFNKKVIATDFETFSNWTKLYIKKDNIFVTWNTTYRDTLFYNEIHFWKNGVLIGYSQKKLLFPFLDYTPMFSQKLGMYTTPIDSSPGSSTLETLLYDRSIGTLVCSEVTHPIQTTNAADKDLIFAIGSEALFSSGGAGEFNLGNTVYRAIENNTPIIRANRLGPSAIVDNNGNIQAELAFGKEGVLHGTVEVPHKSDTTPFERNGQDIFITILLISTFALYYKNRKPLDF